MSVSGTNKGDRLLKLNSVYVLLRLKRLKRELHAAQGGHFKPTQSKVLDYISYS